MNFGTSGQGNPSLGWLKSSEDMQRGWKAEGPTGIGDLGNFVAVVAIPTQGQEKRQRGTTMAHSPALTSTCVCESNDRSCLWFVSIFKAYT
jgi:hypothetical protein